SGLAHRFAPTHEVANQPPPLVDYNVFEADRPLVEAVEREGAEWAKERLRAIGALAGSAEIVVPAEAPAERSRPGVGRAGGRRRFDQRRARAAPARADGLVIAR